MNAWSLTDNDVRVAEVPGFHSVRLQLSTPSPSSGISALAHTLGHGAVTEQLRQRLAGLASVKRYSRLRAEHGQAERELRQVRASAQRIEAQRSEALTQAKAGLGDTLARLDEEASPLVSREQRLLASVAATDKHLDEARAEALRDARVHKTHFNAQAQARAQARRTEVVAQLVALVPQLVPILDELAALHDAAFHAALGGLGGDLGDLLDTIIPAAATVPTPSVPVEGEPVTV